jgi:hypothetical protein
VFLNLGLRCLFWSVLRRLEARLEVLRQLEVLLL